MMKKVYCLFLAILLMLGSVGALADTEGEYSSGDFTFILLADGTAEITRYKGSASHLTIPDRMGWYRVSSIGERAFAFCRTLRSVTIPEGVRYIGESAFCGCGGMTSVSIPGSVQEIGDSAFSLCALEYVSLPSGLTRLGSGAFFSNTYLTSVVIPGSVKVIEGATFGWCSSLTSVRIREGVTTLEGEAFSGCNALSSITIPASVVNVPNNPFDGCYSLTSIKVVAENPVLATIDNVLFDKVEKRLICYPCAFTATSYAIPQGIRVIGKRAFTNCTRLRSVTIPDSVVTIQESAFLGCDGLRSVTLPASVTDVQGNPFAFCEGLATIQVAAGNPVLEVVDGVLFNKAEKRLICCPVGLRARGYTVPEGTLAISDNAFDGCETLTAITIPASVVSIGSSVFSSCSDDLTVTVTEGSAAHEYCRSNNIHYVFTNANDWLFN